MNAFGSNSKSVSQAAHDADATLRLIAALPAPDGLEKRVIAGVRSAPRSGRIIRWPQLLNPMENWLRSAAAAAIVFVVIGGGWGVYSHVQTMNAIAPPLSTGAAGTFSNAGAVRVPQTVPAPVVLQPIPIQPAAAEPAKQLPSKAAPVAHRNVKTAEATKHSASTLPADRQNR
jgi:hypothetical protein